MLINSALYLTSNFIIYFFKYDLGGAGWKATYTLFSTVGGAAQILGMMVLYPLLRKKFSSTQVFHLSLVLALCGYGTLLVFCLTGIGLDLIGLVGNTEETGPVAVQSAGTLLGLRLMMTVLPMLVLAGALVLFRRKFVLTDARAAEISAQLHREEAHHD